MARRVKEIRGRLDYIAEDGNKYAFREIHGNDIGQALLSLGSRETYSKVDAEVIGREEDREAIVKMLMLDPNDGENISVVSIVGIGGLGKTTLAKLVFNDDNIKKHNFELRLWVCVGDDVFGIKEVIGKILSKKPNDVTIDELQRQLCGVIDGKKYLIVLDDVWIDEREKWLELKNLLKGGNMGSKILVTTRSWEVAKVAGTTTPYELKGLSEEKSWCGKLGHRAADCQMTSVEGRNTWKQIDKQAIVPERAGKGIEGLSGGDIGDQQENGGGGGWGPFAILGVDGEECSRRGEEILAVNSPLDSYVKVGEALVSDHSSLGVFPRSVGPPMQIIFHPQFLALYSPVLRFFSSSNQPAFAVKMARQVKEIRGRLDDIAKDGNKYAFRQIHGNDIGQALLSLGSRETYSSIDAEVIGREEDREEIVKMLMLDPNDGENISVVSIVGIGGLGKTTLAKLVYNDEKIENHNFELRLWVCVGDDVFGIKEVIGKILSKKPDDVAIDELQKQLCGVIDGKKYLIVLDDVWIDDREKWLELKNLLKGGNMGSKILVTTHSWEVAKVAGTTTPYELKGLSEEKSWLLFERMAFEPGQQQLYPNLVEIGKEIVKKCANVPLAIRTLGGLLYGKEESE
ncbi:hypothetical protein Dimus_032400 [Dionaea muscipula]